MSDDYWGDQAYADMEFAVDREQLIKVIDQAGDAPLTPEFARTRLTVWIADAILAAGFRRPDSQGEPSDAQVEAAWRAWHNLSPDDAFVGKEVGRARDNARRALRAAAGA